jgi:four helix bundle protein
MQPSKSLGPVKTFHDLLVWQKASALAGHIFKLSAAMKPQDAQLLGLMLTEKAMATSTHIAESTLAADNERALNCLYAAKGSFAALETLMDIGGQVGILRPEVGRDFQPAAEEIRRLLGGTIRMRQERKNGGTGLDSGRPRP